MHGYSEGVQAAGPRVAGPAAWTHLLEVGRLGGPTDLLCVASLEDACAYLRRRTGRPEVDSLARLAWAGGQVQIGRLRLRGWTRAATPNPCPHCGAPAYARAITCPDELDEAGLDLAQLHLARLPDFQTANLVFPAAECPACFEQVVFPNPWPAPG